MVFSTRRCPHTGILHVYSRIDPHLSIGFVAASAEKSGYVWHCFANSEAVNGVANDAETAELRLVGQCQRALFKTQPLEGVSSNAA